MFGHFLVIFKLLKSIDQSIFHVNKVMWNITFIYTIFLQLVRVVCNVFGLANLVLSLHNNGSVKSRS